MHAMLDVVNAILPADKPRYLMGVGAPEDLLNGIQRGVDIFDCVLPTRLARHKAAFTLNGRVNMLNAAFARDPRPIDERCTCYTCQNFTRSYLRHLIAAKESLFGTLISIHNIHTLIQITHECHQAIIENRFDQYYDNFFEHYHLNSTGEQ
jgi:queuine tRNA-ribosyltransferase